MSIPQALPPDRIGGMELRYRVELGRATEVQRRGGGEGAGGSPRAVGRALGRNPYPLLIPCHRVVGKDGGLGGYTGGVALKRKLLELELEAVERLKASGGQRPG